MKPGISHSLPAGQYPRGSWQRYLRAGQKCLATGRSEAALPPLLAANRLHPGHAPVLQSLGAAFLRTGQPDLALAWFDQLLSLNPADGRALHGRGLALHALMDRPAALAAFRQSVACHPDAWQSWESLADITPDEDERIGAVQYAADARLRQCGSRQNRPRNFADCAKALLDARRGPEAVAFIRRNAARFEDEGAAHDQLARAFYETGHYRAALRHKQSALSLGQHDFSSRPAPLPFSPDAATRALGGIAEILDAARLRYFLAAGTLLGFHRSGAPLVHDRDIDVGVLADKGDGPDLARVIREHPGLLLDRRARPGDRYFSLTFQAIAVDIFLYEPCDGGLQCGLGRLAGDVAWRFTSFDIKAADFQGRTWTIPDDPERYLTETYGPRWRTPDTGFASVLSSPALFEVDPDVRAYYALSRAHTCRLLGDPAKARALLRQSPVHVDLPGQHAAFPPTDNDAEDA